MKKAAELFIYKHSYWKNKMDRATTSDEKIEVGSTFVSTALDCFCDNLDELSPSETGLFINRLTKISKSMVMQSEGVQEGFRFNEYWFLIVFCQMALAGGEMQKNRENTISQIKKLSDRFGWNYEDITEPMFDETRTTLDVKYIQKFDKDGEHTYGYCKIILDPVHEFPIGAEYRNAKGRIWKVCYHSDKSIMCEPDEEHNDGSYRPMPFSEIQLRGMERIV